jgi:hypothetical protein
MKRDAMDLSEEFVLRVRGLQAIYPEAHAALLNWANWSRDRSGIFPRGVTPPSIWNEYDQEGAGKDGWGEEQEQMPPAEDVPVKAEAAEKLPYDEKAGTILDERLHGPGGLGSDWRLVLKIAYVSRDLPESQFPRACGCPPHAFAERLESCLMFVSRFAK